MKILFAGLIFFLALSFSQGETTEVPLCPAGQFYSLTAQTCEECPAGTFADGTVPLTECSPCKEGSYAKEGSDSCLKCLPGTYEVNRISCEDCPIGTTSVWESSSPDFCYACPAGRVAETPGSITCSECEFNMYEFERSSCHPCPAGKSSKRGSIETDCKLCPAGSVADKPGGYRECYACGRDTYEVDRITCEKCPAGTYFDGEGASSVASCQACPGGSIYLSTERVCQKCSVGQYEVGGISCESCPKGKISSKEGSVACSECPSGTVANLNGTECVEQKTQSNVKYILVAVGLAIFGVLLYVCCFKLKRKGDDLENGREVNINLIYQNEKQY